MAAGGCMVLGESCSSIHPLPSSQLLLKKVVQTTNRECGWQGPWMELCHMEREREEREEGGGGREKKEEGMRMEGGCSSQHKAMRGQASLGHKE